MKKIDWSKYIGYILFVATVIGWAYSSGKQEAKIEILQTKVDDNCKSNEKQDEILLEITNNLGRVTGILEAISE